MDGALFLTLLSVFVSLLALALSIAIAITKTISTQQTAPAASQCQCQCHSSHVCGEKQVGACFQPNITYNITGGDFSQLPPRPDIPKLDLKSSTDDENSSTDDDDKSSVEEEKPSTEEITIDPKDMALKLHEERWIREWVTLEKPGYNVVDKPMGGVSQDESIVEVFRFKGDCGHPFTGHFDMSLLAANTKYEASVVFMLLNPVVGTLYLKIQTPDTANEFPKQDINDKPQNEWFSIPLGDFTVPAEASGEVKFEMNTGALGKQQGLVMKGVSIKPVLS